MTIVVPKKNYSQDELMKNFLVLVMIISAMGALCFFPLDINGKYTCVFHRIVDHSHPVPDAKAVDLLDKYLEHYALAWWTCIGFFALTVFRWRKISKIRSLN